ncbi:hypothetical protein P3T36_001385 [Kitasatospora sp. MAP12-15]|nr:hypothetical protein [Kitasatospora sp. MAP12-44]
MGVVVVPPLSVRLRPRPQGATARTAPRAVMARFRGSRVGESDGAGRAGPGSTGTGPCCFPLGLGTGSVLPYARHMTSTEASDAPRYVRLSIELIAEITDEGALKAAALAQVEADEYLDDEERTQSVEAIEVDPSGSLAHFIDPVALLGDVPGIELTQATWESAQTEFDPEDDSYEFEVE